MSIYPTSALRLLKVLITPDGAMYLMRSLNALRMSSLRMLSISLASDQEIRLEKRRSAVIRLWGENSQPAVILCDASHCVFQHGLAPLSLRPDAESARGRKQYARCPYRRFQVLLEEA